MEEIDIIISLKKIKKDLQNMTKFIVRLKN